MFVDKTGKESTLSFFKRNASNLRVLLIFFAGQVGMVYKSEKCMSHLYKGIHDLIIYVL